VPEVHVDQVPPEEARGGRHRSATIENCGAREVLKVRQNKGCPGGEHWGWLFPLAKHGLTEVAQNTLGDKTCARTELRDRKKNRGREG